MNAGRLINMALRMLMRAQRQKTRKGGVQAGKGTGRKLRSALRIGRMFGRS